MIFWPTRYSATLVPPSPSSVAAAVFDHNRVPIAAVGITIGHRCPAVRTDGTPAERACGADFAELAASYGIAFHHLPLAAGSGAPAAIRAAVRAGAEQAAGPDTRVEEVGDRGAAIATAIDWARAGDVVAREDEHAERRPEAREQRQRARAARDDRVRLIDNPRRLQAAAVNLAVERFGDDHPWLLRLDAHSAYPPDFGDVLLAEGRRTGADSVVVSMHAQGQGFLQRAIAEAQNSRLGNGGSAHRLAGGGAWVDHGHHAGAADPGDPQRERVPQRPQRRAPWHPCRCSPASARAPWR